MMSNLKPIKQAFGAKALRVNADTPTPTVSRKHVSAFGKFVPRVRAPGEATSASHSTFATKDNRYTPGYGDTYKYNGRGVAV
jgi:hypothetical protein